jgi:transposase
VSGEFVAAMEEVLDLYAEPYDPTRPLIVFDETSKQLSGETRSPLPARPGQVARYDYEYQRNGTRNIFLLCEPLGGWRHVAVTEQRTMHDFATQMKWLVDERYPHAEVIRVVLDNLNTHKPGALYETFAPAEAHRLCQKLEFHYTPKHGSWLNMAEIELSLIARQCLHRRIATEATLKRELAAVEGARNTTRAKIHWQFTTAQAREKLAHLYPSNSR